MPVCKRCKNDHTFIGTARTFVRTLVEVDSDGEIQSRIPLMVANWVDPINPDTCASCGSTELIFPEIEIPF